MFHLLKIHEVYAPSALRLVARHDSKTNCRQRNYRRSIVVGGSPMFDRTERIWGKFWGRHWGNFCKELLTGGSLSCVFRVTDGGSGQTVLLFRSRISRRLVATMDGVRPRGDKCASHRFFRTDLSRDFRAWVARFPNKEIFFLSRANVKCSATLSKFHEGSSCSVNLECFLSWGEVFSQKNPNSGPQLMIAKQNRNCENPSRRRSGLKNVLHVPNRK